MVTYRALVPARMPVFGVVLQIDQPRRSLAPHIGVKKNSQISMNPFHNLTPGNTVLEKLIVVQEVKKVPTFYGAQSFSKVYEEFYLLGL